MENVSKASQKQIKSLINLFHAGQMTEVVQACRQLLKTSPHSLAVINILGAALQELGKLEEPDGELLVGLLASSKLADPINLFRQRNCLEVIIFYHKPPSILTKLLSQIIVC